ncbi:hypothetical protein, partial [Listeria innocua]|uniref:hypothetical protein n=1 Tax=Listeria innocua TaxID=1642 RepID=UPI001650C396
IQRGLGSPTADVPAAVLAEAAVALVDEVASLTLEQLAARAREARDALDEEHVIDRERQLRESRYLRLLRRADGSLKFDGLADPE